MVGLDPAKLKVVVTPFINAANDELGWEPGSDAQASAPETDSILTKSKNSKQGKSQRLKAAANQANGSDAQASASKAKQADGSDAQASDSKAKGYACGCCVNNHANSVC